MNSHLIRFGCVQCGASIRAHRALGGQRRNCPACRAAIVVPRPIPEDAGSVLVSFDCPGRVASARTPRGAFPIPHGYGLRRTG